MRTSHFSVPHLTLYALSFSHPLLQPQQQAGAGNALCNLLSSRAAAAAAAAAAADPSSSAALAAAAAADSQLALEGQLLEELLVRAPDAHWARARLAGLQLQLREYDAAVGSYQAAIRCVGWEGVKRDLRGLSGGICLRFRGWRGRRAHSGCHMRRRLGTNRLLALGVQ